MRQILSFLAGAVALGLTQWTFSDRTNSYLSLAPRKIETRVTIYVKEDPTNKAPSGNFSEFLMGVGLKEAERKRILDGVAAGFISEVRFIQVVKLSEGEEQSRGISFDVIDGRFSRHAGAFSTHISPPRKEEAPLQLHVPQSDAGR